MIHIQIIERRGKVRGPAHQLDPPDDGFIQLSGLEENQRVVHVKWRRGLYWPRRKTVDWYWTVTIEARW